MHPAVIIIPAAALIVGPRLWVNRVLKRYDQNELDGSGTAAEVARSLLDDRNLQAVKVERTDLGDHYDPDTRSVRISRDKHDRKSLTAVTTAAHEVGHALQHATQYTPFVWRIHLTKVARVAGEVGSIMLLSVPVAALATRNPVPAYVIGFAALGILGTGMAVQLVTLPTEFDASFNKALRMLEDGYADGEQLAGARKILLACSMTYVAASLASVLNVWPWLPRRSMAISGGGIQLFASGRVDCRRPRRRNRAAPPKTSPKNSNIPNRAKTSTASAVVRRVGKPLIRSWFQLSRSL
jgi:Zn-dependent membrane protease YugP